MDNSFFEALSSLGSEANVDTALLVEKVKSAMLKAARKARSARARAFPTRRGVSSAARSTSTTSTPTPTWAASAARSAATPARSPTSP